MRLPCPGVCDSHCWLCTVVGMVIGWWCMVLLNVRRIIILLHHHRVTYAQYAQKHFCVKGQLLGMLIVSVCICICICTCAAAEGTGQIGPGHIGALRLRIVHGPLIEHANVPQPIEGISLVDFSANDAAGLAV